MREPPDLRELVGDDVPLEELERLRRADALLRAAPAPPHEIPHSLTASVERLPKARPRWTRPRIALAFSLAAALAALGFGLGRWTEGDEFDAREVVPLEATEDAPGAAAVIRVGERDEATGNWQLELEVSGLPKLPPGGYYDLWLAKDGEYAATCGSFSVGKAKTTVRMNVSYRLRDYDAWVITAQTQGEGSPWLLTAKI
jgi:Anti-sigma-K factor rskA